jgi:hypothetical protein
VSKTAAGAVRSNLSVKNRRGHPELRCALNRHLRGNSGKRRHCVEDVENGDVIHQIAVGIRAGRVREK